MRVKKSRILEEHHIREYLASISFLNAADVRDAAVIAIGFMSGCRIAELYNMKRGGKGLYDICISTFDYEIFFSIFQWIIDNFLSFE